VLFVICALLASFAISWLTHWETGHFLLTLNRSQADRYLPCIMHHPCQIQVDSDYLAVFLFLACYLPCFGVGAVRLLEIFNG
jgi:hypothetical protein